MISCKKKIQRAHEDKALFYKPWIGRLYDKGVRLINSERGMRVLVIGASRYCEYLAKHGEQACPNRDVCCFCYDYDRLMSIADDCPFVNDSVAREGTHRGLKLDDINLASILKTYYGQPPKAYKRFQKAMVGILGEDEPQKAWLHLAFVNYFQPIVWGERKDATRTPLVSNYQEAYEKSRCVIEEIIKDLEPDLILVWQSSEIRRAFDSLFPDAKLIRKTYVSGLKSSKIPYLSYCLNVNGRRLLLQTTPHPSANYDYRAFIEKASKKWTQFQDME